MYPTIKSRKEKIKEIVEADKEISNKDQILLKKWYLKYYTPAWDVEKIKERDIIGFKVDFSFDIHLAHLKKKSIWIIYKNENEVEEKILSKSFLAGSKRSREQDLKKAMRNAINPLVSEFRYAHGNPDSVHVDHVIPFVKLVADFLSDYDEKFVRSIKTKEGNIVGNDAFVKDWIEYHKNHAYLQFLSPEENMDKGTSFSIHDIKKGKKWSQTNEKLCWKCQKVMHNRRFPVCPVCQLKKWIKEGKVK